MKVMFLAFCAVIAIAFAADGLLQQVGFSAADRTSSSAVRLD